MKIAHIVPHSIRFPLTVHNGRHDWVLDIARRQAEGGHDVTIYCHPDSNVDGLATTGIPDATRDVKANNLKLLHLAFQNNHDIYHSHFDDLHYECATDTPKPIVFTQHWWPKESTLRLAKTLTTKNVWAVPPTKFMFDFDTQNGIATKGHIYHGIDLDMFGPSEVQKNGRLLFVSRISPEKNLEIALAVSKKSGIGLDIIGKVAGKNLDYWESLQKDIDGDHIRYLGPKSKKELINYYSAATATLFPSHIQEPFGLIAIESQACGTPVIMLRGGSRGELIEESRTGFLCAAEEEFVAAVKNTYQLHKADCVEFARKFDVKRMTANYQALYETLVGH